jgi:hypothetical protein
MILLSPQYWFYLFLIGTPLGLLAGIMLLPRLRNLFVSTFLDRLLKTTFGRVIFLLPVILLSTFFVIILVTITPWITGIIGAFFVLSGFDLPNENEDNKMVGLLRILIGISVFFASYLFYDMTWGFTSPLFFEGFMVLLALLPISYSLGILIVLITLRFWPWLKARKAASFWVCKYDCTRTKLEELPWLVRWSGRFLAVEEPKKWEYLRLVHWKGRFLTLAEPQKYDDFADYFVCRTCGKNHQKQAFYTDIHYIKGTIGGMSISQKIYQTKNGQTRLAVKLFPNAKGKARSADIDRLEIHELPPGETLNYDYAVNAVLIALSNDHGRKRPLKKVPVTIYGNPPLSENTRRLLANEFGEIKECQS